MYKVRSDKHVDLIVMNITTTYIYRRRKLYHDDYRRKQCYFILYHSFSVNNIAVNFITVIFNNLDVNFITVIFTNNNIDAVKNFGANFISTIIVNC